MFGLVWYDDPYLMNDDELFLLFLLDRAQTKFEEFQYLYGFSRNDYQKAIDNKLKLGSFWHFETFEYWVERLQLEYDFSKYPRPKFQL
jgi:hypothetical protein